jgi:hypothetical protein
VSAVTARTLRTVAFVAPEDAIWGVGVIGEHAALAAGELREATASTGAPAAFSLSPADEEHWQLAGAAGELLIIPAGDPVRSARFGGLHQLCLVRGQVIAAGNPRPIESVGLRTVLPAVGPGTEFVSLREVSAWFGPAEAIALTALRPARARGHDRDVILASLFNPAGCECVADPRLSTTYSSDGFPARVGLELWLDDDDEDLPRHSRRAGADAVDASLALSTDGLDLHASALRWHSGGREGHGIYLLSASR